jgi:hypothetical protein
MKRLYFAHPRLTYNTEREKNMLKKIKHVFSGCRVINPGKPAFQKKMETLVERMLSANEYMKPFFQIINKCDCLVFMPLVNNNMGVGTFLETKHAEACMIPVYTWDGVKFITNYKLTEIHCHGGKKDYKDYWAKVEYFYE